MVRALQRVPHKGCNSNGYRLTPQRPRPLTVHSAPNAHINLVTPQFPRPFTATYTAHNTPEQRPHEQRCRCQLAAVAAHGVSDSSSQGERNGDVDGLSTHGALQGANGARGKDNAVRREGRLTSCEGSLDCIVRTADSGSEVQTLKRRLQTPHSRVDLHSTLVQGWGAVPVQCPGQAEYGHGWHTFWLSRRWVDAHKVDASIWMRGRWGQLSTCLSEYKVGKDRSMHYA